MVILTVVSYIVLMIIQNQNMGEESCRLRFGTMQAKKNSSKEGNLQKTLCQSVKEKLIWTSKQHLCGAYQNYNFRWSVLFIVHFKIWKQKKHSLAGNRKIWQRRKFCWHYSQPLDWAFKPIYGSLCKCLCASVFLLTASLLCQRSTAFYLSLVAMLFDLIQ